MSSSMRLDLLPAGFVGREGSGLTFAPPTPLYSRWLRHRARVEDMRGVVAIAGFVLGALLCLVLAVAEWGAWMLVAPGRRLGRDGKEPVSGPGEPIEAGTGDGLRLAGSWYPATSALAARSSRTAIVIHGYAEDPLGFRDRAEALARRGWNAAAI